MFFYTEARHKGITLRAHPDYTQSGNGPWYDFAFFQFEGKTGIEDYPCRILAFFKDNSVDGSESNFAIVQSTCYLQKTEAEMRTVLHMMDIACRYQMDTTTGRRMKKNGDWMNCHIPVLRCVPLNSVQRGALVFEEDPGL